MCFSAGDTMILPSRLILTQVWFGRYAVFRQACFLPLECMCWKYIASAEKTYFIEYFCSNKQQKHTNKNARRGSLVVGAMEVS